MNGAFKKYEMNKMNKLKLFSSRRLQIVLYAGHTNSTVIVECSRKSNQDKSLQQRKCK